jgi:hypothetical protein
MDDAEIRVRSKSRFIYDRVEHCLLAHEKDGREIRESVEGEPNGGHYLGRAFIRTHSIDSDAGFSLNLHYRMDIRIVWAGRLRVTFRKLHGDIGHLATAVHSVVWIYAMRTERRAVNWIFRELWLLEAIGSAAETTTAFGLLAFWVGHL